MSEDNGGGKEAPECLKGFLTANEEYNAKKDEGDSKPAAETEMADKGDGKETEMAAKGGGNAKES